MIRLLGAGLMLAAVLFLGYGVAQSSFSRILPAFGIAFLVYVWQAQTARPTDLKFWLVVALLLRLSLVGAFPSLSDDIYRFVWDGRIWLAGGNPFDHLPRWYMDKGMLLPGLTETLFNDLNSPDYYTIYPPVAQALFAFSVWLFPGSVVGSAVVMQLFLCLVELGTMLLLIRLLRYWSLPEERVLWYALNPLIIVEVVGNLHFEGAMIFFLLLGLWALLRWKGSDNKWWLAISAVAMAMAVSSKLLPLLFFPFLIRRLGWWRSVGYFTIVGGVLLLSWLPLYSQAFFDNFGSSVNLYFRRFEFNGSIYYFIRWLGYQFSGFNLIRFIGPALAAVVFLSIVSFSAFERIREDWRQLPGRWLIAISIYLFCATTVHPWYTALPLVLCLFTHYRWPVLWSGLIVLTYINYSYGEYFENLWIVLFEYSVVFGYLIWEYRRVRVVRSL
ncbi:MAG: glycosyltransferase 87 family protein [Bacteroidota bacterium]